MIQLQVSGRTQVPRLAQPGLQTAVHFVSDIWVLTLTNFAISICISSSSAITGVRSCTNSMNTWVSANGYIIKQEIKK